MERLVFTYKDVEEAKKYIGKPGRFSEDFRELHEGRGVAGNLTGIDGYFPFVPDYKDRERSNWPFFSPDPEPVEKWVPFTAEDWELFLGKVVREFDMEGPCGSIVTDFGKEVIKANTTSLNYQYALERLVFMDGKPFGKKVTE